MNPLSCLQEIHTSSDPPFSSLILHWSWDNESGPPRQVILNTTSSLWHRFDWRVECEFQTICSTKIPVDWDHFSQGWSLYRCFTILPTCIFHKEVDSQKEYFGTVNNCHAYVYWSPKLKSRKAALWYRDFFLQTHIFPQKSKFWGHLTTAKLTCIDRPNTKWKSSLLISWYITWNTYTYAIHLLYIQYCLSRLFTHPAQQKEIPVQKVAPTPNTSYNYTKQQL